MGRGKRIAIVTVLVHFSNKLADDPLSLGTDNDKPLVTLNNIIAISDPNQLLVNPKEFSVRTWSKPWRKKNRM